MNSKKRREIFYRMFNKMPCPEFKDAEYSLKKVKKEREVRINELQEEDEAQEF